MFDGYDFYEEEKEEMQESKFKRFLNKACEWVSDNALSIAIVGVGVYGMVIGYQTGKYVGSIDTAIDCIDAHAEACSQIREEEHQKLLDVVEAITGNRKEG